MRMRQEAEEEEEELEAGMMLGEKGTSRSRRGEKRDSAYIFCTTLLFQSRLQTIKIDLGREF